MSNQWDTPTAKGPEDEAPSFAAGEAEREIGMRVASAVKAAGGSKAISAKSGIPLRTLARLMAGQDPKVEHLVRLSQACGVSLDWLATGQAPSAPSAGSQAASASEVDARLRAVMDMLAQEEVPITAERLRTRPDLASLREELDVWAGRADLSGAQRNQIDLLLRLAFGDMAAIQRARLNEERLHARLNASGAMLRKAVDVVGWSPPAAFSQALRTLCFNYDVTLQDAISLLDALRNDLDTKE